MNLNVAPNLEKSIVFEQVLTALEQQNFTIVKQDQTRPWGGFFVIDENQATAFATQFFPHLEIDKIKITNKILVRPIFLDISNSIK